MVRKIRTKNNSNWYTLSLVYEINPKDHYRAIVSEVHSIFGINCPFFLPGDFMDSGSFDSFSEGYIFVFCNDISRYESKIQNSNVFWGFKDDFGGIFEVNSQELVRMQLKFEDNHRKKFRSGDLIRVNSGLFSNLIGIITSDFGDSKYEVFFRFFSREMLGVFNSQNLTFIRSGYIFSQVRRVPVLRVPVIKENNES